MQTDELMPVPAPKMEVEYLADQSQVKVVVAREAPSYDSLDTFRKAKSEGPKGDEADSDDSAQESNGNSAASPAAGPAGEGGFWKKVGLKTLMGGMAPPSDSGSSTPSGDSDEEESGDTESNDEE